MKYVLDTCTYYWLVDDQTKLSDGAKAAINNSDNSLHLSVITVTELHRLVRKGKLNTRTERA
jgi:PIN domain nuclease of toxin-antitoxin system